MYSHFRATKFNVTACQKGCIRAGAYLYKVAHVFARRLEGQVAHERHVVLSGSVQLQLVAPAHVPVVRAVAGCNSKHKRLSVSSLAPPPPLALLPSGCCWVAVRRDLSKATGNPQ
jgi:hypothetical protein